MPMLGNYMAINNRVRLEKLKIAPDKVDEFLRARMSPECPVQIMRWKHRKAAADYMRRKGK